MFNRLFCRSARTEAVDRTSVRALSVRAARGLVILVAIPVASFLTSRLAAEDLQPVREKPKSGSTFQLLDEKVTPIRLAAPDTGVKLLSHTATPPQSVTVFRPSRSSGQTIRIRSRKRSAAQPLPQIDDLVNSSRQTVNVEELIEFVSPRDEFLNELRRTVNPVQELPLPQAEPKAIESGAITATESEEPARLPIRNPMAEPVPQAIAPSTNAEPAPPVPATIQPQIVQQKIVEVIRVQSEPKWIVMKEGGRFRQRVLGRKEVTNLLTRARMELASGDMDLAHAFAEAAAEVEIPIDVFSKKPELILTEIDYVTSRDEAVVKVDYDAFEQGGTPDANSPTQQLAKDPRGYRAIGKTSMSVRPKAKTADGESQQLPEPTTRRQLALLPEVVQQPGFGRGWNTMSYSWQAPALYHSPLYFEQVEVERYGNEICGIQPWVSGAHFYATVFTLPYQMGIEDNGPFSCHYDLGHNRPGECVPYSIHALPFSWTGALTQGAVATGLAFVIP